ncbi:MAG: GTP cyclohydrolase II, partial [Rhodospirillales bacterium]|nr:GTP cyclohydrolase II [Rhodospirillales bacterium]
MPLSVRPQPVPPAPRPLVAVDRAIAELRRGGIVRLVAADGSAALVMAAEAADLDTLARLQALAGIPPDLAITRRRAGVLHLPVPGEGAVILVSSSCLDAQAVCRLADPCAEADAPLPPGLNVADAAAFSCAAGAVALAKLARLLPSALVVPLAGPAPADL